MKSAVVREIGSGSGCAGRVAQAFMAAGWLIGAGAVAAAEPGATPGPLIEISSSNLPRFDNFDGMTRSQQRIDMALLSPGRSSFGVTMGLSSLSAPRYGLGAGPAEVAPGVNVGLQWRYVMDNNRRIDITAWRDLGRPNDALSLIHSREGGYGARVEMQLKGGSRSPFVADRGFIGVQLDGGARITVRRSHGRPMVYYRNKF